MPRLLLISTVSFLKLLEIGMHSLDLLYPLQNVLRNASLDSHYWWDLVTSPLTRSPRWMNVCWCVTSKILWFWFWKVSGPIVWRSNRQSDLNPTPKLTIILRFLIFQTIRPSDRHHFEKGSTLKRNNLSHRSKVFPLRVDSCLLIK